VAAGEFVALLGPSGCGKTTLLNLCAGLVPAPPQGRIRVCGEAVQLGGRRTAYMLARDSLLPWATAEANAAFGLKLTGRPPAECREAARAMLARVGLAGFEQAYPKMLSHGMRQRVALARTFALDADLLLMDEPFGALDAMTRAVLQVELSRIWAETRKTVLFITHDIEEACALATRVGVMKRGPGGTLKAVVEVDLPFPRERTSDGFMTVFRQVHALIHEEIHGT
jgi:NitT/TauT family transport system ATP-binding protein